MLSVKFYYIINIIDNIINIDFSVLFDSDESIAKYKFKNKNDLIVNLKTLVQSIDFKFYDIDNNCINRSNCLIGFYHGDNLIFGVEYQNHINDTIGNLIDDLET
jgi:hypothetical protein